MSGLWVQTFVKFCRAMIIAYLNATCVLTTIFFTQKNCFYKTHMFLQVNCENSPRVFLPGHNKFLYLKIGGAILAHSSRWSNNNTLKLVNFLKQFFVTKFLYCNNFNTDQCLGQVTHAKRETE